MPRCIYTYEVMCLLTAKAMRNQTIQPLIRGRDLRPGTRSDRYKRVLITSRDFHAWSRLSAPLTLPYLSICTFSYTLITRPYIALGRMEGAILRADKMEELLSPPKHISQLSPFWTTIKHLTLSKYMNPDLWSSGSFAFKARGHF